MGKGTDIAKPPECPLCAGNSPIYDCTLSCCRVRLVLAAPTRSRRAAILAVLEHRQGKAAARETKRLVEAAFASRSQSQAKPPSCPPSCATSPSTPGSDEPIE